MMNFEEIIERRAMEIAQNDFDGCVEELRKRLMSEVRKLKKKKPNEDYMFNIPGNIARNKVLNKLIRLIQKM